MKEDRNQARERKQTEAEAHNTPRRRFSICRRSKIISIIPIRNALVSRFLKDVKRVRYPKISENRASIAVSRFPVDKKR